MVPLCWFPDKHSFRANQKCSRRTQNAIFLFQFPIGMSDFYFHLLNFMRFLSSFPVPHWFSTNGSANLIFLFFQNNNPGETESILDGWILQSAGIFDGHASGSDPSTSGLGPGFGGSAQRRDATESRRSDGTSGRGGLHSRLVLRRRFTGP